MLFDRSYSPLWERSPGQTKKQADPADYPRDSDIIAEEVFFPDGRGTSAKGRRVLKDWGLAAMTRTPTLTADRLRELLVTGHTHQPGITRISHGARHLFGVDAGCIASLNSCAFGAYTEMAAAAGMANWASGFVILTFKNGVLLPPEPVLVLDEAAGLVAYRGERSRWGAIPV